jgi:hypothetical protein
MAEAADARRGGRRPNGLVASNVLAAGRLGSRGARGEHDTPGGAVRTAEVTGPGSTTICSAPVTEVDGARIDVGDVTGVRNDVTDR